MIYNNYPDDYIVINAKWVEWDNDEQRWCFMTEDAFEKAQSLADYTKQVRKEVCEEIKEEVKKLIEKDFKLCNHEYANGYCYGLQYDLAKILEKIEKGETR